MEGHVTDMGALELSKPDVNSSPQVHSKEQLDATNSVNLSEEVEPSGSAHTPEHQNGSEHSSTWDQVPIGRTLEVDSSDTDSAIGSDTASSSVTDYRFEHGRRYHAYHEGAYYLPNDELESDRLDLQHHVWRMTLNGALYISPLPEHIENVLDIGTGTGIWAIEFAQEHPSALVTGIDLSPIQPTFVPPNCTFIVDNAEAEWIYAQQFDFVHARMLILGMHDWPRLFQQSWTHLKPGGWIELQELQLPCRCDDGSAALDSPLIEWSYKIMEATAKGGIDPLASDKFEAQLQEQGFVNIKYETIKWAIGSWPRGKEEKDIGRWTAENTLAGLQAISMAVLTRHLNWSPEAVELYLVGVRNQIRDRSSHVYLGVRVVSAQKPYESCDVSSI